MQSLKVKGDQMSTYCSIKSKLDGNVIDIQGNSTQSGALLDAFPTKTTGNDNQQWEFIPDPAGSGYYFIKSKLSGNVIDVQENSTMPGALLDAFNQKTTANDNQLWRFIQDPAGSGYCFIQSKLSGNVIDIVGQSKNSGAGLDAFPIKTTGNDNQLWEAVGGAFPSPGSLATSMSWSNLGTGPEPATTSSGSTTCNYSVSLTIQQDGTCHFWGNYTNRAASEPFVAHSPNQSFGVSMVVHDLSGKGYSFSAGGNVPSAPQAGCTYSWDTTQTVQAIADNWNSIAARAQATYGYHNESNAVDILGEILAAVESAISTTTTLISDVETVISVVENAAGSVAA
jgi:hypothetical protein